MSNLPARIAALLEKPSLEGLAFLLDNPAYWPASFAAKGWHFRYTDRCAMGLANCYWGKGGWERAVGRWKFWWSLRVFVFRSYDTQPHEIASDIRAYLANHPAPPRSGDGAVAPGAHPALT